jgi:hypothetical protein
MEYHRKRAKALLRSFQAGEREAARRAEAALGERARQRFLLSDAQYVVAREAGYRTWPELVRTEAREETFVESDVSYGDGDPVVVRVRRRGHWIRIDDDGVAVERAGRPPGWLQVAKRVVGEDWLNVNRRGVVFVSAQAARPVASLVTRVADRSAALYQALLELDDE